MNRFYVQCPPGFKARNPDVFDWADRTKNSLKLNIKAGKWYLGFDNQQDLQYFVDKWLTPLMEKERK